MTPRITFVSAGAGSGKTYRLTEILHTRLASGGVRPSGVIATTFTRKAAAELRERARTYLMGCGDFALATALDQARIGTVNSVCGELLLRFAFEAGLPTEQQVLDEDRSKVLLAQAIDSVMRDREPEELTALADRLGVESWQEDLRMLVDQVRANDIEPAALAAMGEDNAVDLLAHFPPGASRGDLDGELSAAIDAVLPALEAAAADRGILKTADYLQLCRDLRFGLRTRRAAWSQWAKLSKAAPEVALVPVVGRVAAAAGRHAEHPRLHADLHGYLSGLFGLCARALDEYAHRKRETGLVDFVDQEHLLLRTLDHPEVRDRRELGPTLPQPTAAGLVAALAPVRPWWHGVLPPARRASPQRWRTRPEAVPDRSSHDRPLPRCRANPSLAQPSTD